MNQPRTSLWRRVAAIAAAAGVLLLSVVGCAMTGSAQPTASQAATVAVVSDTQSMLATAVDILATAAGNWQIAGKPFFTLLRGAGKAEATILPWPGVS